MGVALCMRNTEPGMLVLRALRKCLVFPLLWECLVGEQWYQRHLWRRDHRSDVTLQLPFRGQLSFDGETTVADSETPVMVKILSETVISVLITNVETPKCHGQVQMAASVMAHLAVQDSYCGILYYRMNLYANLPILASRWCLTPRDARP